MTPKPNIKPLPRIASWDEDTWTSVSPANPEARELVIDKDGVLRVGGDFTNTETLVIDAEPSNVESIICGYCDTKQNEDNPYCQSCGGSLNDDISFRRNNPEVENVKFGITAMEAVDAFSRMFG